MRNHIVAKTKIKQNIYHYEKDFINHDAYVGRDGDMGAKLDGSFRE